MSVGEIETLSFTLSSDSGPGTGPRRPRGGLRLAGGLGALLCLRARMDLAALRLFMARIL